MYPEIFLQTPNVGPWPCSCEGLLLHHTAGSYGGAVAWLCNKTSGASAHVVIAKNGHRTVLAGDRQRTWHAGDSIWKGRKDCNTWMMGVEFEGDTNQAPLTKEQIESFCEWFAPRKLKYNWKLEGITDHRTVTQTTIRKVDLKASELQRVLDVLKLKFYNH